MISSERNRKGWKLSGDAFDVWTSYNWKTEKPIEDALLGRASFAVENCQNMEYYGSGFFSVGCVEEQLDGKEREFG